MKQWFPLIVTLLGGVELFALACSSSTAITPSPGTGNTTSNDSGIVFAPGPAVLDAGNDGSRSPPDAPPQTLLRIAHLSPDLSAIDICVAPHGTQTFQGPLIGQLSIAQGGDPDAATPGLTYAQVSAYLSLDPGAYDVRIVAAGASSCDLAPQFRPFDGADGGDAGVGSDDAGGDAMVTDAGTPDASAADAAADAETPVEAGPPVLSGIADVTNLPSLGFNVSSTLLIAGELTPVAGEKALTFTVITDDEVLVAGAAVLRAVNAVPSVLALDFGFAGTATDAAAGAWLPLLTNVAFAAASAKSGPGEGAVDSNGYLPIAPLAGQAMSARTTGVDASGDIAASSGINVDLGGIATVIAIGGKTGDTSNPPALLLCTDNQPSGGLLSDCSIAH